MILELDKTLFHFINVELSNPVLDFLFVWIRHPLFWVPLYVFIACFMLLNYGRRGYLFLLFLMLVFGSGDLISSRLIKPSVERIRPCNQKELFVIERVKCGSGYSFTSSHATNHFALTTFVVMTLGTIFKRIKVFMWTWAGMISVAQIYVGVHFPLDILGGAVFGILIGWGWAIAYERFPENPIMDNNMFN